MKLVINITIGVFLTLFFACKKDHTALGVGVQPSEDALNASFSDKTPVYCYSALADSIISSNTRYKFLGSNEDPYFGKTDVGLYLNTSIEVSDLDFGKKSKLAYADLIIALDENTDYSGSFESVLNYSVYPIDSLLYASRGYFATNDRLRNSNTVPAITTASYSVRDGKKILKLAVSNDYANELLHDTPNLANNTKFQAKYKGFYVKASNQTGTEGVVYKVDMEHALSGFYLHYYADSTQISADSLKEYKFNFFGTSSVKFNTIKRDLTKAHSNFKSQLQGDTAAGTQNLFLKGLGFSKIKVRIPDLIHFADTFKIAVNRAEFIFYPDPQFAGGINYLPPPRLTLLPLDSVGREMYTEDQLNSTDYARYDGTYDVDHNYYVFNIARHVQAILNNEIKNCGFNLVVANSDQTLASAALARLFIRNFPSAAVKRDEYSNRVVLAGSNNAARKPRFNLSYVRLTKP